jgi:hypothetical protein
MKFIDHDRLEKPANKFRVLENVNAMLLVASGQTNFRIQFSWPTTHKWAVKLSSKMKT